MSEPAVSTTSPARATLGGIVPILRVENLDAAVGYYVEQLGFQLEWKDRPLAGVGRDGASLMLSEGDQGNPGTWLWISTSDADALYAELQARGARLRHPPTNHPWESRECQVSDLDGHVLRFGSESAPGAPLGDWLDGEGRRWSPQPDGSWRAAAGGSDDRQAAPPWGPHQPRAYPDLVDDTLDASFPASDPPAWAGR